MADITIKDFKGGLDARKFRLSLPAGTLLSANNGHINQGGEFEKRKAFVLLANTNGGIATSLPTGTFGAQPVANGTVVFGSQTASGLTFPANFTYQQLIHPAVLNGTAYNGALHAMTAVITSETFAGLAWVAAQFADGNVYSYYNGALIVDFVSGLILAYQAGSDSKIAAFITQLINLTASYTATQRGSTNALDIFSLPGNLYTTTVLTESVKGTLTAQLLNNGLPNLAGLQSIGQFQIVSGTNGVPNFISAVKVNGVNILKGGISIAFGTTVNDTANAVANSINSNAATSGFFAVAQSNIVIIQPLAGGTSTNGYVVSVTAAGNVCIGNCSFQIGGDSTVGMTSILSSSVLATTTGRYHLTTVCTLVIGVHNFLVGEVVTVSGMGTPSGGSSADYNGAGKTLTAVGATTISYASSRSFTEASAGAPTADTGGTVVYSTGVNIMGGAVPGNSGGLSALATAIVTAINANSGATGFLANSVGAVIFISKSTMTSSDLPISMVITPAAAGLTVSTFVGTTSFGLTTYSLAMTANLGDNFGNTLNKTSGPVSVVLGGQTNPPFTYLWTMVSGTASQWLCNSPNSATTTFSTQRINATTVKSQTSFTSTWKCTIIDSASTPNTFTTQLVTVTWNYSP